MKICVVGTGASGWITALYFSRLKNLEIVVIGSPSIPTIGVGESTTLLFKRFIKDFFNDSNEYYKFLKETDASIKYGVNYQGWGQERTRFLHGFNNFTFENTYTLGNLDKNIDFNLTHPLSNYLYDNFMSEDEDIQSYTFHFDANKLISYFEKIASKIPNITFYKDTVIDSVFSSDEEIDFLVLESGNKVKANFYVSCIGQTAFNQKIFKEEYISYSDVLLTDKALFTPLEFKNKRKEFHPYTTAKTMKNGWRWITPTYSRIGTGYVFSSNHITEGQAIDELRNEIGDPNLEPHVVDFFPRKVKKVFKGNFCTVGMASGFLEPLDAPGLHSLIFSLNNLDNNFLKKLFTYYDFKEENEKADQVYNYWCSFILHQYKTCSRNDTSFWIDHKNVNFPFYNEIIDRYFNKATYFPMPEEPWMFFNTTAGKGLRWEVNEEFKHIDPILYMITNHNKIKDKIINHLEYFDWIHRTF